MVAKYSGDTGWKCDTTSSFNRAGGRPYTLMAPCTFQPLNGMPCADPTIVTLGNARSRCVNSPKNAMRDAFVP
jgi:hypothetical protein